MLPPSSGSDIIDEKQHLDYEFANGQVTFRQIERSAPLCAAAPPSQMGTFCRLLGSDIARLRNIDQNNNYRLPIQPQQAESAALPVAMDPDWDEVSRVFHSFSDSFPAV